MFSIKKLIKLEQISTFVFSIITFFSLFSFASILRNTDGSFRADFFLAASGMRHAATSLATFTRLDVNECYHKCVLHLQCESISFSAKEEGVCELSNFRYEGKTDLIKAPEWNYYDTSDACDSHPCYMFATCHDTEVDPGYRCKCKEGYEGERCDKLITEEVQTTKPAKITTGSIEKTSAPAATGLTSPTVPTATTVVTTTVDTTIARIVQGNWLLLDTNVCFEPKKRNKYGKVTMPLSVTNIHGIMLEHTKGMVSCDERGKPGTYWGCNDDKLYVFATIGGDDNRHVLPSNKPTTRSYSLPGYDSLSRILTLKRIPATSRFALKKDAELRVWHQTALEPPKDDLRAKYSGKTCATVYADIRDKWLLQESDVCFEGRKGHGSFRMKISGILHSIRLVHKSGGIKCSPTKYSRKWGCFNKLSVYVSRKNDKEKIFPHGEEQPLYDLTGFTSNSPELIFAWPDNFYTNKVTEGQILRIWFGKDLNGENKENHGKSCIDVYARRKDGYVLQKRDVCFEGINGKYGEFKLNFPGELFGVKLIHRSGYVGCSAGEKTNWGCNENLSVFVTDEQNKVLYPREFDKTSFTYTKHSGVNADQLVFGPRKEVQVEKDEELRVWNGEVLFSARTDNNSGKTCFDVYANIKGEINGHTQSWYPDGDTNQGVLLDDLFNNLNLNQLISEPTMANYITGHDNVQG